MIEKDGDEWARPVPKGVMSAEGTVGDGASPVL